MLAKDPQCSTRKETASHSCRRLRLLSLSLSLSFPFVRLLAKDFKRRRELLESATSAITKDPGKIEIEASRVPPPASSDDAKVAVVAEGLRLGYGLGLTQSAGNKTADEGVEGTRKSGGDDDSEGCELERRNSAPSAPPGGIFRGDSLLAEESPGSVPLEERARKHRKYYKVGRDG